MVECVTLFWLFSAYGTTDWPSLINLLCISNSLNLYLNNHIQSHKPRHITSYLQTYTGKIVKKKRGVIGLNSQKRFTHSTIKVLHQPTSSECVTTFPRSLPRACPNDNEGKLQKGAMILSCAGITPSTAIQNIFPKCKYRYRCKNWHSTGSLFWIAEIYIYYLTDLKGRLNKIYRIF